jgi:hypothetical protein
MRQEGRRQKSEDRRQKTEAGGRLWLVAVLVCASAGFAQETQKETIQFSNPSAPHKLNVELMVGSVTVKGYNGQDAIVEYSSNGNRDDYYRRGRAQEPPPPGMHRIGGGRSLEISEDNNVITIRAGIMRPINEMNIQVPADTSVTVKTLGGKAITIENISGEIEANNMNGQVIVTDVSGPVVAHSMNGKVTASLNRVLPGKDMSFTTFNGDVDVTLPADAKANLKMRADNGDIYTDFDVKLDAQSPIVATRPGKPKVKIKEDGMQSGSINGGGPEIQFTTFNGRIVIHKK